MAELVPVALACGCVIEGTAHYDIDPGVRPPLVECENGHGWQEFVIEPEPTCEPGCVCGDVTLCGTADPELLSVCPKCGALVEDLDGFGVLIHEACGYCSHPDIYGDECRACGKVIP